MRSNRIPGWRLGLALLAALSLPVRAHAQTGDVRDVPDPSIIRAGNSYYVFSTEAGIGIRRSPDLYHWSKIGTVFQAFLDAVDGRKIESIAVFSIKTTPRRARS